MSNLKWRLLTIVAALAVSAWFLFPRDVTVKRRDAEGVLRETVERRVPLNLGLDLQGGMQMALEIDDSKQAVGDKADALDRALKTVRTRLEGFGVSEPVVQKQGDDRILVALPGLEDPERAIAVVREQAFLEFKITDETQALEKVLPRLDGIVRDRRLVASTSRGAATPATPAQRGLQGLLNPTDSVKGDSTKADTAIATGGAFSSLIQQGGMAGEYYVKTSDVSTVTGFIQDSVVRLALPPGKALHWGTDSAVIAGAWYRPLYVTDARAIMTGEHLTDARPNTSPLEGTIVQFTLDNVGGRRFRNETGKHVQDYMAIVLDGRVMGRPPVIQSAIGTQGQITMGGKDLAAAQDLALVLRAGALPVPLRVAEIRQIGPSLGQDSIQKGLRAGILGLALVVLIMIVYYRFSGVLSVAGLIFYAITTLAMLAAFGADLTLPGIAGFILSIGMAVDANFLQFERIREELERGKTVRTAVEEGFKNSFSAIIDTHVTTALTGAVLYQYGTGPVKGFAVTLVAGVASSMISSVFVVRTLFLWWLSRSRGTKPLSI
ncbi:MAG TPA: protein translocase subunit SecD [Gemmatimonadaceae bacterium]|nr:protein translocase subunit SecD [Gemmatimonadaceae bacterium]